MCGGFADDTLPQFFDGWANRMGREDDLRDRPRELYGDLNQLLPVEFGLPFATSYPFDSVQLHVTQMPNAAKANPHNCMARFMNGDHFRAIIHRRATWLQVAGFVKLRQAIAKGDCQPEKAV